MKNSPGFSGGYSSSMSIVVFPNKSFSNAMRISMKPFTVWRWERSKVEVLLRAGCGMRVVGGGKGGG